MIILKYGIKKIEVKNVDKLNTTHTQSSGFLIIKFSSNKILKKKIIFSIYIYIIILQRKI
jgi:hypothetical protein